MARGFGSTNFDGVCKCENPNIIVRGYSGNFKKTPIYYCFNCRKQFKSNSKKWELLTKERKENDKQ